MNQRSSRSHAIFTITVEQRREAAPPPPKAAAAGGEDSGDEEELVVEDYLCAKMHLVDLAGKQLVCLGVLTSVKLPRCSHALDRQSSKVIRDHFESRTISWDM